MADKHGDQSKFPWPKVAAIASSVIGAAMLIAGGQNFFTRAVGLILVLYSVSLHRNERQRAGMVIPSRSMWILGLLSAGATLLSFQFLYWDALGGYNQVWPVYAFALVALIATGIWAAIFARWFQ
jgi:hypothetical protein